MVQKPIQEQGGGAYFMGNEQENFKLDNKASIFTAELYSILKSLQVIERSNNRKFTILCDSKSAIQKINSLYSDHPIVSKIQDYIIMLHSRHKSICICWVPSHINIEGNERADQLAKQAAQSQGEVMYIHYPHKDYYSVIKNSIRQKWQQSWDNVSNNKLKSIKPDIKSWPSSKSKLRKIEVVLTRLRIGHSRLTHGHLMEQRPPPYCEQCIVPLTIKHIIAECPEFNTQRQQHFKSTHLQLQEIIGEKPERKIEINDLIKYLTDTDVLSKL